MSLVLAIDQSTSATKAVLFDAQGRVLDRASRDHRQIYPQPGWVEHDPEEIWQNVLAVIRDVATRNPDKLAQLAGLSITNQRETILAFDRATGRPLHNAIVWQCRRGEPICRKLREQGHEDMVRARTGLKIDTYFSASKLDWLVAEKPDIAARLSKGDAVIGTIDTYLIHRLTGGNVFATDHTNASRTLLFDIGKLCWDEELCRLFHVPLRALPEVRESAAHFGDTDAAGVLPKRVPIRGVMGDSQASLFSQRCYQPGMAKATFGTGTSVLLNIGDRFRVPEKGAVVALAWVWQGKPAYACEGIINFSAATIEWLKNQLGLIQNTSEVEALAGNVEDNGGVYLVPAFAGLSAPYWSPDARAAIVGMTAFTRKEHIVRAALESIAYQVRDALDMMRADAAPEVRELCADGGPTRNGFLMQFTADMTGVDLKVSEVAESSAWGAAMNGLLGLGFYRSLEDLMALPRETKVFRPQMNAARVRQLVDGWQAAVKRVL
ncbi:MAG TPA: glycerol kinase GlpK [Verrucomicrobiae bacterium]|nr:glycerol kinase GlpK [Verrucomicrobiae bacterium]